MHLELCLIWQSLALVQYLFYILFNDALNTFYLRLYGVRHMVKDHSDSERENRCRHMGYSFRLTARVLLYEPSHRHDCTYHGLCYTGALAWTRNSSKVHTMKDRSDDPSHHERTLLPRSYITVPALVQCHLYGFPNMVAIRRVQTPPTTETGALRFA